MPPHLTHIALGGTISMRIVDGLAQPTLTARELAALAAIETTPVDLATVGGPQLTFPTLAQTVRTIAAAADGGAIGVIVTLGTDAIEEVAAFLAYSGPYPCNVVVTGSMEPGAEPGSDGPQNLRDAAAIATRTELTEPVVVFAGQVTLARAVVKVSGLQLDAFASPTASSWSVAEVLAARALPDAPSVPTSLGLPGAHAPEVPIVMSALSVGPTTDASSAAAPTPDVSAVSGLKAIVCVSSGAGNLTPEAAATAHLALRHGALVAIATRALDRQLAPGYGYPGGSGELARAGAILATGMSPHRLRIFLLIALSQQLTTAELSAALRGHVESLSGPPDTKA